MSDNPSIRQVTLDKLKLAIFQSVSPHLIDACVEYQEHVYFMADEIRLKVTGYVWAETLESKEFKWPADWWEAFKEQWFPAWALRRWPVRYERHKLDVKAVYPNLRPNVPRQEYVIHVLEDWGP